MAAKPVLFKLGRKNERERCFVGAIFHTGVRTSTTLAVVNNFARINSLIFGPHYWSKTAHGVSARPPIASQRS
jgi:hypothetical protein